MPADAPAPSPPRTVYPAADPPAPLPPPPPPATTSTAPAGAPLVSGVRQPALRITTEYDSRLPGAEFLHKASCRVFGGLAKLRLSLRHGSVGFSSLAAGPELAVLAPPHLALFFDAGSGVTRARTSLQLADSVRLAASHNLKAGLKQEQTYFLVDCAAHYFSMSCTYEYRESIASNVHFHNYFQLRFQNRKEQQGEVALLANLGDSPCKIELASFVPPVGLPKATLFFPDGEVSVAERKTDDNGKVLSLNGVVKSHFLNGLCTTFFNENEVNIKYHYKDEELTFTPRISLPSNALSFAFKRSFSLSDKLSYWYNFDSSDWKVVYKRNFSKDLKMKTGYDSDVRRGWASLWVGDENGGTKMAPGKTKLQITVQIPQDDFRNPVLSFHVKKRWDF